MITLLKLVVIFSSLAVSQTVRMPMKIISTSVNQIDVDEGALPLYETHSIPNNDLAKTVRPANFSGPPHLKQLIGHCFTTLDQKYQYKFCPFQNLTQQEVLSSSWSRYKGVLGVWGEWQIESNHFVSMKYLQGDKCDEHKNRSVTIKFKCSEDCFGEISEIKEPHRCQYEATFSTQLVCHPHSLLVYPWLSESAQREWDELYTNYKNEDISKKDFETNLNHLLTKSGLLLKSSAKLREAPTQTKPMSYLNTCDIQLIQLRSEVQRLKEENTKLVAEMKKLMQSE
ncbi:N-acetylglucosamine-1-phosphotransferase subunit gamma-like isoform X2 [Neocloeon triangulifer]|uniref:N-acetylglucosamine-1-phosphotransferase subunit gamma-like isoform X2 n=1 Tax=Neocloeon triangulifer TaxID=2078957 RepID=UPI00286F053D|nr:N-acetylglucosamine-1-phosphotransferase subunit gamma-like isoform X2 [Neocloeon triangulifer]